MKDSKKTYVELSDKFRKSNASRKSIDKLYDFMYELEKAQKSEDDVLILSYVYSLLGFHQSAHEMFKSVADLTERKNTIKLFALGQKSKSHKNNFVIKDIRELKKKKEQPKLSINDIVVSNDDCPVFNISGKDIVIFNKIVKGERVQIYLPDHSIELYIEHIQEYITWLNSCKNELIQFYNNWVEDYDYIEEVADEDWYDTLEVYSLQITVETNGLIHTYISGGDEYNEDHILDIETYKKDIVNMNYDG